MIAFWIAALTMLAVALAIVIPPIAVSRGNRGPSQADVQRAMYREQLADLTAQHDAGSLDQDSFRQAREELDRDFLEQGMGETAASSDTEAHPYRAAIVAVLIPVVAIGLYLAAGTPSALLAGPSPAAHPETAGGAGTNGMPSVDEMVASLEERLTREPGDAEGWVMLARSYQIMNRPDDVHRVLQQALGHHPNEPAILVHLAESTATRNDNRLEGEPIEYVNRALALQPDYPRALWLAGIHALSQGDPHGALKHWERLLVVAELEPGARAQIQQAIADARKQAGITAPPTAGSSPTGVGPAVSVTVTLADAIASRVNGDETLFVFARAPDGPPVPLAVQRFTANELPLTLVLDDSHAMAPEMKISQFDSVVVTARISRSGTPTAQSGDLQGVSAKLSPGDNPSATVVIEQVVK